MSNSSQDSICSQQPLSMVGGRLGLEGPSLTAFISVSYTMSSVLETSNFLPAPTREWAPVSRDCVIMVLDLVCRLYFFSWPLGPSPSLLVSYVNLGKLLRLCASVSLTIKSRQY